MRILADVELAWLAGVLEQSGCFHIESRYNVPALTFQSVDIELADRVAVLLGLGVHAGTSGWGNKPVYRVRHTGAKAGVLLASLIPYLGKTRAAQAREVLDATG